MRKKLIYFLLIALFAACDKDDDKAKTSGEETLSSQLLLSGSTYIVEGFLFDGARKVSYGPTLTPYPDLVLENIIKVSGSGVEGANIASPQNDEAFYLVGEFGSQSDALAAFNNLKDASAFTFVPKANNIKKNQVYVFKTRGDKYAKLMIKDLQIAPTSDYVIATIQWIYQPDGLATF